jgi:ABC-type multidrug transport system fused ATPase/permease subunit
MILDITEKKNFSAIGLFRKVFGHLGPKRKKQFFQLFFFTILDTLASTLSLATLIPFVTFFANSDTTTSFYLLDDVFQYLNISGQNQKLYFLAFMFICLVLMSLYFKVQFTKRSHSVIDNITSDFRIKIFNFLIHQDYSYYFQHGSNGIMSNLLQKSGAFASMVFAVINISNSFLITAGVITVLVLKEPFYTPLILLGFLLFYSTVYYLKANIILKKGQVMNNSQNSIVKIFENTVGYLPEIIIYNLRKFYLAIFSKVSKDSAHATATVRTIAALPRIYLEALILISAIGFITFSGFSERPLEENITYLAILGLGAQKILPLINLIFNLSVSYKGLIPMVSEFLHILDDGKKPFEYTNPEPLNFNKCIKLEKISFQYNKNTPKILNNINFVINKGDKVVVKGETGSGKSTLVNIISGLLTQNEGKILIDDTEITLENKIKWQKNISIVPQSIFLNDSSILENIAIAVSINDIDIQKVKKSAQLAQIDNFIESLPNGYNEQVGERGVRLSGGQKQRIGIARALYRNSSLILLDEPTNALDSENENLVMSAIINLNKDITVVMISHSDSSLKLFDKIIDVNKYK